MILGRCKAALVFLSVQTTLALGPQARTANVARHTEAERAQVVRTYVTDVLPVWNRMRSCIKKGSARISADEPGQFVLEMTFPNSGTSITHSMAFQISGWENRATVYSEEVGDQGLLMPGTGDVYSLRAARRSNAKFLTKTHCNDYEFAQPVEHKNMSFGDCVDLQDEHLLAGILRIVR